MSSSPRSDTAALRLVCLPYAGGGSAVYHRWRRQLPDWIDLLPVVLPGHDGRLNEPPRTDLRELAAALADELQPKLEGPFAILGYSMGALLGFELVRGLPSRGGRMPELLVVAASRPPHGTPSESTLHTLPDDELVAAVDRRYGGIAPAVRDSPELLQLLLPALRADLQMVETYQPADEPPLDVPILALGGTDDPAVSASELGAWRRHTRGDFAMRLFPGRHFFLFEATTPPLQAIVARLERMGLRRIGLGGRDDGDPG